MKKRISSLLLASTIALTLAGCTTSRPSAGWEYKSASTYPEAVGNVVTKYGKDGWKFISMSAATSPGRYDGVTVVLLFKRHKTEVAARSPGSVSNGLPRGAVAYWKFEGNGQDSVGHHDLVIGGKGYGPLTLTYADGKVGQAMSQTGNTRSFQLPKIPEVNFNTNFTLSVWLYRERSVYDNDAVFDNGAVYLAKRDAAPWDSRMGVYLTSRDEERQVELVDNSSLGEPPLQTWFHVLVYREGNTLGIKVNNQGTATVDVSGMDLQGGPVTFIGQQQAGYPWQGRLDELGLWNRKLTPNEMAALYNSGNGLCR